MAEALGLVAGTVPATPLKYSVSWHRVMGTSWRRTSWYLQLPRTAGVPWSGVVRLECSADLPLPKVTRLGDLTARVLPSLARAPHKDPRALQNLIPIGGLECQLRHRLGDQQVLYRALRAAAIPMR